MYNQVRKTLVMVVVVAAYSGVASAREWTDVSGKFSVEAELVELADGQATLKRPDGRTIKLPLERLCDADRRYLAGQSYRTWTANQFQEIEARFVDAAEGNVRLKKRDGRIITIPVHSLSEEDRQVIAAQPARPAGAVEEPNGAGADNTPREEQEAEPKKPDLQRQQRGAERKEAEKEASLKGLAKKLGDREDGYFLVALMAKEMTMRRVSGGAGKPRKRAAVRPPGQRPQPAPQPQPPRFMPHVVATYAVDVFEGRDHAAEAIFKFLNQSTLEQPPLPDNVKIPRGAERKTFYKILSRFDQDDLEAVRAMRLAIELKTAMLKISPMATPNYRVIEVSAGYGVIVEKGERQKVWTNSTLFTGGGALPRQEGLREVHLQIPALFGCGFHKTNFIVTDEALTVKDIEKKVP